MRVTTLFNKLLNLQGLSVIGFAFEEDDLVLFAQPRKKNCELRGRSNRQCPYAAAHNPALDINGQLRAVRERRGGTPRLAGESRGVPREVLRLEAKHEATILAPTRAGMPFLGWQVSSGTVRLRPQNLRRTRARLRHRRWQHSTGQIDEQILADAERSVEHLRQGHTLGL